MAGLLSNAMSGIGGLLGNPRTKQALLASFASGGDPYATGQIVMARQQQDADAERERKMEEYRQIQLETARRANEEAQKRQAQEIISRTVVNHFAENPNAVAFGGPGATQQQQLAGLLGRGVDTSVASGLIAAGAGPKLTTDQDNYERARSQGYTGTFMQYMREKSGAQGPQPRMVEQGGVQYWAEGPNAGQPVLAGAAAPVGPTSEQFDVEKKLRGEVIDATKPFNVVQDAAGRILSTAKDPSAAGDLSLIFSYMKMLDPGSTVREGEFATAQNAAGVPVQIQNLWNKLKNGERLSPAQRADFLRQAGNLYGEAEKGYTGTRDYYTGLANQYQVSPDRVVTPGARYTADQFKSVVDSAAAYLAAQGKK